MATVPRRRAVVPRGRGRAARRRRAHRLRRARLREASLPPYDRHIRSPRAHGSRRLHAPHRTCSHRALQPAAYGDNRGRPHCSRALYHCSAWSWGRCAALCRRVRRRPEREVRPDSMLEAVEAERFPRCGVRRCTSRAAHPRFEHSISRACAPWRSSAHRARRRHAAHLRGHAHACVGSSTHDETSPLSTRPGAPTIV